MKAVIVGGGPAGLLAAMYLLQRPDYQVELYERRPDFRSAIMSEERTFPIGLQSRGLGAIRGVPGLEVAIEQQCVGMTGIQLHKNKQNKRPRTIGTGDTRLFIERNKIASTFYEELTKAIPAEQSSLKICFESSVEDICLDDKSLTVKIPGQQGNPSKVNYDALIVADGARSKLRPMLAEQKKISYEQVTSKDEYKSLYLSRQSNDKNKSLDGDKMHSWMFGTTHRVISVPTRPHECSGVFIFPSGQDPLSNLTDAAAVQSYFNSRSPGSMADFLSLEEAESLRTRPVSSSVEVVCDRLTVGNDILLIGDACHAVSASLGQGCNSALQDVQVFAKCLDEHKDDWAKALPAYNQERLPDAQAVCELSSYSNPRTKRMSIEWLARLLLNGILPKWLSRRVMRPMPMKLLTETDLPYSTVLAKTRWWTDRVKASCQKLEEKKQ